MSSFWSNKHWWMTPITLGIFALLLIIAQNCAIAPFIYSFI